VDKLFPDVEIGIGQVTGMIPKRLATDQQKGKDSAN